MVRVPKKRLQHGDRTPDTKSESEPATKKHKNHKKKRKKRDAKEFVFETEASRLNV